MAVKSSGANANLSFNSDIVGEFGGSQPHQLSEYKRGGSLVPNGPSQNANIPTSNANIQFSDFFGSVNAVTMTYEIIGGGGEGAGGYTGDGPGSAGSASSFYGTNFSVTAEGGAGGVQPAPFTEVWRIGLPGEASFYGSGGAAGLNSDSGNQTVGSAAPSSSYGAGGGGAGTAPFASYNGGGGGEAGTRRTGTAQIVPGVNFYVIIGPGGSGIAGGGDGANGYAKLTISGNVYQYTTPGLYTLQTNGSTVTQVSYSSSPGLQEITVSSMISSGGTYTIPGGLWLWSDSTSTAALTIDIPCTIINNGYIIGRGGNGGHGVGANGQAGGHAIKINSGVTGVTIVNNSGAYIAGGGGGGASGVWFNHGPGGGGGAGGGIGGGNQLNAGTVYSQGGLGGAIGQAGQDGPNTGNNTEGRGGTAGGSGGGVNENSGGVDSTGCGGGGGRVLPGVGVFARIPTGNGNDWPGGYGGGPLQAGGNNGYYSHINTTATGGAGIRAMGAGGGGWGAAGGSCIYNGTTYSTGGAAGKAINDSGVSYTLTNNGTVYGAT